MRFTKTQILGVMLLASTGAAADSAGKSFAEWDRYIERVHTDFNNVGVAVAVVHGDKVIYARGFGVREAGKTALITPDTLFEIGSTSKAFATAALGVLVDEGKIRWDDPVIDHWSGLQMHDPYLTQHLTIRDAVTHRSGIPNNFYPYMAIMDSDQALRQLRYLPAQSEFRNSFQYNNLMYGVTAKVVQAASGLTWQEFMKRRVLEPLEMKRSGTSAHQFWDARYVAPTFYGSALAGRVSMDQSRDANVAMPHGVDENGKVQVLPWITFDNAAPAGSLVSSAADMANWLIMHLNEGRFAGRQVLKADTVRELHTAQNLSIRTASPPFPLDKVDGYAMGWFAGAYRGHVHLAHGGGMLGFPAYMAMLPEQKIGVVVLSNGPTVMTDLTKLHSSIEFWVLDRVLQAPLRDWGKELLAQAQVAKQEAQRKEEELRRSRLNAPPSVPLEKYAGDYEDKKLPSGLVTVRSANGRLELSFGKNAFAGVLEHWHGDLFRLHTNAGGYDLLAPQFTRFTIDPAGKVVSMSITTAYFSNTLDRVER